MSNEPTNSADDERSLAERIYAGDRNAEDELISTYSRGILFLLKSQCHNDALAEDLLQDAILIVISRLRKNSLNNPKALPKYIRQVAMNLLIGEYRKNQRQQTAADQDAVERAVAEQLSGYERVHKEQVAATVHQFLGELSQERDKQLLRLYYLAGLDKVVICKRLNLTPAHFDRVLHRAKKRLRKLFEENNEGKG